MAHRHSSKTSTVMSKTTQKVIFKKTHTNTQVSSEEKNEAAARKADAILGSLRKTVATTAKPLENGSSYATTMTGGIPKIAGAVISNYAAPVEAQRPVAKVWAAPSSNTEYQKLQRPGLSIAGTSAISKVQISSRSVLGPISGNNEPGFSEYNRSVVVSGPRPTDKIYGALDFQVGAVFSVATHQQDFSRELNPRNPNQSMTRMGIIYSKFRKFVVIARFATHVIALPIYTHGGNGLANKRHRDEFVSIRDSDLREEAAGPESTHKIVWTERHPAFKSSYVSNWFMMSNCTSIHLAAPYSHPMSVKCTISGQVHPDSIIYLQQLFRDATNSAFSAGESSVKPIPDVDGFTTIRPSASKAGSTYWRQSAAPSVLRGRSSYIPQR